MNKPRYSVITPSIGRHSLIKTCESLLRQTYENWEHIIVLDNGQLPKGLPTDDRQLVMICPEWHNNWGNTCRRMGWLAARGTYCYYLDDDNELAHPEVLADLCQVAAPWALAPIIKDGGLFFHYPPEHGTVDTGNVLASRELAKWPDVSVYEADWLYVKSLLPFRCQLLPGLRPVMRMPKSNRGELCPS